MISLRLTRVGKKKQPIFRLIAIDKKKDPWAPHLEILGLIDPRKKTRELNAERIKYWLGVGAQPSETVHNLLVSEKILEAKKKNITHISGKRKAATAKATATAKAA